MDGIDNSTNILISLAMVVAVAATLALGGCASTMSSGTPDDAYSASIAPNNYERPYQVGAQRDEEEQPESAQAWTAEQKYEYRGGRDPVTGRAKTQM